MRWSTVIRLSFVLTLLLAAAMFTVQNSSRTTLLSFDVYFAAWELARPVPVSAVVWASVAVGALITWMMGLRRRISMGRTIARLEQEALLRSAGRSESRSESAEARTAKSADPVAGDDWGR
jgi:uncharacterized integral membrane protein